VTLSIDGIGVEPGDIIRITSQEGVGSGSEERPLFVRDWAFDPKTMRTSLLCRDLTDILEPRGWAESGGGDDWDGSTDDEQAENAFWAEDDDTVPTDGIPSEWR